MSTNEKKYILGCDIGNGFGYISLLSNPKADPIPLFPVKYSDLTKNGMPTTAYVLPPTGEDIEVFRNGKAAEKKYVGKPDQLISAIKTRYKEGFISVPGVIEPVEVNRIYSAIARDLILLAEEELKNLNINPVYNVVFTFPASFSDNASLLESMQRSIERIKINGESVQVLGRLPEPAAVAIDYLHYMQHIAPGEVRISDNEYTVLVYDLGHGTFDAAVVTAKSDGIPYKLHSKAGLPELGGRDFDQILYDEIVNELHNRYDIELLNEMQRDLIRQEAVNAKITLSDSDVYISSIMISDSFCEIEISRERFEELSQHLVFQTLELVQSILDDAISSGIKIDGIVMSGGASQMPMIKKYLEEMIEGEYPISLYRPSEAVSFGAARYAVGIPKTVPEREDEEAEIENDEESEIVEGNSVIEQMTDCCYGIWLPAEGKLEGVVSFVIPKGKKRPVTSKAISFYSGSSRIIIKVYRSKNQNMMENANPNDCESIIWMPFDVKQGSKCEVTITVLENYGVQVDLKTDTGEQYRKTTSDILTSIL